MTACGTLALGLRPVAEFLLDEIADDQVRLRVALAERQALLEGNDDDTFVEQMDAVAKVLARKMNDPALAEAFMTSNPDEYYESLVQTIADVARHISRCLALLEDLESGKFENCSMYFREKLDAMEDAEQLFKEMFPRLRLKLKHKKELSETKIKVRSFILFLECMSESAPR